MKIDCLRCFGGKYISIEEGLIICDNCGVEIPLHEYEEMLAANATILSQSRPFNRNKDKHLTKVQILVNNIKDELELNDSLCNEIVYLYTKAYREGYPCRSGIGRNGKHYFLTECLGASIYIAALAKGKKYKTSELVWDKDKKGRQRYEYRNITFEQIQNVLNKVIPRYGYKPIKSTSRIERCARLMVKELDLKMKLPPIQVIDYKAKVNRKILIDKIKFAIVDITDKLQVKPKVVTKALSMFESSIRRQIIDTDVHGHKRKPKMVAAAFIDLACRQTKEKVRQDQLRQVAGVGRESFFKIKKILTR